MYLAELSLYIIDYEEILVFYNLGIRAFLLWGEDIERW